MRKLTRKEKQKAMTEFRKDIFLDVLTITREDGTMIIISRGHQIVGWKEGEQ